jgi:hypothetical protein
MIGPKRTEPTRGLLQGGPYTPAIHTDLRALFKRIRTELAAAQKTNVKPMRRKA